MALRISGVVFFSESNGPPGAIRIMKNVTVAMMNNTGINSSMRRAMNLSMALSVCAKTRVQQEPNLEQNDRHPDPLPSDGRGNNQTRLSQFPKRLDTPTDRSRFS